MQIADIIIQSRHNQKNRIMLGNIDLKVACKNFYIFIVDDFTNNKKNPFSLSLNFFKEIPENGIMFQLLICFLNREWLDARYYARSPHIYFCLR